jgi:hypothetical protein
MSKAKIASLIAAITVGVFALAAAPAAHATSLTCTNTQSATTAPYGCGGLQIAPGYKDGVLDLSAQNVYNTQVTTAADSAMNSSEDFTVFALNGLTTGGPGDLGEYVAMVTPLGKISNFTIVTPVSSPPAGCVDGATGTNYTNAIPCAGVVFTAGPSTYCLSVSQYKGFNNKTRWWVVLRDCDTSGTFTYGTSTKTGGVTSGHANHWQLWGPTLGPANTGLGMVNVDLWNKNNVDYDLNISGMLGAGTPLQAYPNTSWSPNEEWDVIGCTPPVSTLVTAGQIPGSYDLC